MTSIQHCLQEWDHSGSGYTIKQITEIFQFINHYAEYRSTISGKSNDYQQDLQFKSKSMHPLSQRTDNCHPSALNGKMESVLSVSSLIEIAKRDTGETGEKANNFELMNRGD
ncbi:hypothetical protein NPIL_395581 [Nephila pilipes]|uniref:Uncharacterized protein n=1 Tax=Nephila pilipes TaxID=299642 RepID=A0A8X6IS73_NEPPI|nr:hypothetical protein NPIL_395581 [Nephila pilipes]